MMYYFKPSNQLGMLATTHPEQASPVAPLFNFVGKRGGEVFFKSPLCAKRREGWQAQRCRGESTLRQKGKTS